MFLALPQGNAHPHAHADVDVSEINMADYDETQLRDAAYRYITTPNHKHILPRGD